jgi:DNA-binding beta-propeller fold protein YncE
MSKGKVCCALAAACGVALSWGTAAAADAANAVVQRWKLGGPGGWDYLTLDAAARRLYVTRGDRVVVLDADSGKSVGEIANTDGVHGVALAPELGRGFASNGRSNSITVFDIKTLKTLQEIKVDAQNPDAILYDPSTQRVFTFNGRSANASAFDAKTGSSLGNIALSGKPEFAVSDEHGRVYVNIEDKSELTVIDPKALKVVASWPLKDCEDPTGLAIDTAHRRLFSVCQSQKMIVTDSADGHEVASVAIGKGPDGAVFDAERSLVFSSNGEGTLTVVHEDDPQHYHVVENVTTQKSARTLALDPKTHHVFLAAAEFGAAPAATAEQPHPRPPMVADSFTILVVGEH